MDLKNNRTSFKLNISRKLFLGYMTLIVLTILTAVFSLNYFKKLNSINENIIQTNIPVAIAAEKMLDSLYSQELHGNRYVILKSKTMMSLFLTSINEFRNQSVRIKSLLSDKKEILAQIDDLHHLYVSLFQKWFQDPRNVAISKSQYEKSISEKQDQLVNLIQEISSSTIFDQNNKIHLISLTGKKAFRTITALCLVSIMIGIGAALIITRKISISISLLKKAIQGISQGNFNSIPMIRDKDELGELALSFAEMAKRLKKLEEMDLDANPLTRLPGSIAIENILKKRLRSRTAFAFCLVDLDHFKVFNDYYGYVHGNKVLTATSHIIEKSVEMHGSRNDFVGHIGGDDFVILTSTQHYKKICQFIIHEFDKMIIGFYNHKDLDKGFIKTISRNGREEKFPIMTVSIAVVTNKRRKFEHHIQIGELAAELKNYAKTFPRSLFIEDRRKEIQK